MQWEEHGGLGDPDCSLQTLGEGTSHLILVTCNMELSDLTHKLVVLNYLPALLQGLPWRVDERGF